MSDWNKYHDCLLNASSTNLATSFQGVVLKFQIYGEDADLCSEVRHEQLKGDHGTQTIVDAISHRDFYLLLAKHIMASTNFEVHAVVTQNLLRTMECVFLQLWQVLLHVQHDKATPMYYCSYFAEQLIDWTLLLCFMLNFIRPFWYGLWWPVMKWCLPNSNYIKAARFCR